jgi:hypothetical protein
VEKQLERITTEGFEAIDMKTNSLVDHRKLVKLLFQIHHRKRSTEPSITD